MPRSVQFLCMYTMNKANDIMTVLLGLRSLQDCLQLPSTAEITCPYYVRKKNRETAKMTGIVSRVCRVIVTFNKFNLKI